MDTFIVNGEKYTLRCDWKREVIDKANEFRIATSPHPGEVHTLNSNVVLKGFEIKDNTWGEEVSVAVLFIDSFGYLMNYDRYTIDNQEYSVNFYGVYSYFK